MEFLVIQELNEAGCREKTRAGSTTTLISKRMRLPFINRQ